MVKKIKNTKNFNILAYFGLVLFSFLVLSISVNKLMNIKNSLYESRVRIKRLENDLDRLDTLVRMNEQNQEKIEKMEKSLPETYADVSFFARTVENIAKAGNENIELTIDDESKKEGNMSSLKFSIESQGNFESLKNLLTILSSLPYHTKVDSLKVDSDQGSLTTMTNFRLLMK